ncbi:MAG: hypothetical protein RM347_019160 [Nostoc sp. ChiQUE02]|uniref:hypothetical protein n=1 Tax=Nostoc sp. ChiQUE02 TaxID=3075377 RepID=UPI003D16173C
MASLLKICARNFVGWLLRVSVAQRSIRPNTPMNVGFRVAQPNLRLMHHFSCATPVECVTSLTHRLYLISCGALYPPAFAG